MEPIIVSSDDDQILHPYIETDDSVSLMDYEDPFLTSPLLNAINANDTGSATAYIKFRKYLKGIDNRACTPLLAAVSQQNMEIINLLLQSPDIDKDCKDFRGNSPLYLAAKKASDAIVIRLLEEGCNVNVSNSLKQTPLHAAVKRPSILIAHELVKRGANINQRDFNGFTPLLEAIEYNNLEAVCMLLYYGVDVNICCSSSLNPFMRAVNDTSKLKIARTLFDYYSNFSTKANDGYTALLLAANSRNPIAIDIINAGADVNCIPGDKKTVLFFSLYYPNATLFKEVWNRINLQQFSYFCSTFLLKYVTDCRFSQEEWLECMYTILDCSIILKLIDKYIIYLKRLGEGFFEYLIMSFCRRNIELNDRLAIIISFLSNGVEVSLAEIDLTLSIYGFNEEVEAFINCASITEQLDKDHMYFPLSLFILGQEDDTTDFIVKLFIRQLHLLLRPYCITNTAKHDVLQALGFFSFPYHMKQQIIHSVDSHLVLKETITERLEVIPELPSLMELTRNQIRRNIKQNCKTEKPYQFYKAVNELPLPDKLKNILLFKQSLYP